MQSMLFSAMALAVAIIALAVSITVAFLRRSIVKMTQPTIITFGYTEPPNVLPNVSLNTLLFAKPKGWPRTRAVGGRVIESMYIKLSPSETPQNFLVWYHGNERAGLFVSERGLAEEHRFFTSKSGRGFRFTAGTYGLEVFACLVGDDSRRLLFDGPITLKISQEMEREMATELRTQSGVAVPQGLSLQFNWEPELAEYLPPVLEQVPSPFPSAPDYGEPELTLPNGEPNQQNWMLYKNQQDLRLRRGD
jgi:hypothetical protein